MSESRTTTIWVKSGNTRIGKVIVNQKGSEEEAPYFYVGSSFEDAYETSATTYNYPAIESNDTSLKYVYYVTNMEGYFLDVVSGSDTINSVHIDDEQKHIVFVTNVNQGAERYATLVVKSENNDTLATINITQKGKSEYYFYWGNTGSGTSTATTAESEETTTTAIPYRTTYTNLTYNIVDSWITSVTLNNNTFVAGFSTNQGESDRTGTVQIKSGNDVVGTITIMQKKPSVVYSIEVYPYNGSAGSTAQTSTTVTITAINQGWSFNANGTSVTADPSTGNAGTSTVTLTFPAYNGTRTVSFVGDEYGQATFTYTQSTPTPPTPRISCTWEGTSTYTATTTQGNDLQAKASLNGSDVTNSVTWTSEDNTIATVSNTGLVTAVGPGTVKIYASMAGATGDFVQLTVENEPTPDSLEVRLDSDTIAYTGTTRARAFLTEHGETTEITNRSSLEFTSENEGVATVNNSSYGTRGLVTGHATGTTNIYATYYSLTSNSVQLTVTGSPYDPANWAWYDVRIVTGSTSAQTAVTESIHINESSELIAIAYVTSLGKTIDVTSGSEFSFRSGDNTGTISNGYFTATNAGTAEIISTYRYQGGSPVTSQSYVTINVQSEPVVHDYYLILSATSETTTLQTGVTETISFAALVLDRNNPSYKDDVTSQCMRWYVSSGGAYAESGRTAGDVKLKSSPTSEVAGEVTAIYIIGSSATANFTILPPAAPTDKLTGITVRIEQAPDIPASGGTVDCSDITYTVTAHYTVSSDKDVTNDATIIDCSAVTASSKGTVVTGITNEGELKIKVSYTEGLITVTDTDEQTIYQEENKVEYTYEVDTGETTHDIVYSSRTENSYYDLSIDPTEKTVDDSAGSFTVTISLKKITPTIEYHYETWYDTYKICSAFTSTATDTSPRQTGTTLHTGNSVDDRRVYVSEDVPVTSADASESWLTANTGGQISYPTYNPGHTDERTASVTFSNAGDSSTCVVTQKYVSPTPPTPTRTITIHFTDGLFKNDSENSSIVSVHCSIVDDMSHTIEDVTWDNDVHPLEKGQSLYYPTEFSEEGHTPTTWDYSYDVQPDFSDRIWFTATIDDIELSDGTSGKNPDSKNFYINTTTSQDDYDCTLPDITWFNI